MLEVSTSVAALSFLVGFLVGSTYARHRIYERLLKSNDPQSWDAAHRIHVPNKVSCNEDSDCYPPTPTRLKALCPLQDTVKMDNPADGGVKRLPKSDDKKIPPR